MPQGTNEELYQFQDTVSLTHGRHTVRFGADVGRQIETDVVAQNALGGLSFAAGGAPSALDNFLDNFGALVPLENFGPTPHRSTHMKIGVCSRRRQDDVDLTLISVFDMITSRLLRIRFSTPHRPELHLRRSIPSVSEERHQQYCSALRFRVEPHFASSATARPFHGGIGASMTPTFTNIATTGAQSSPNAPTGSHSNHWCGLGKTTLIGTISPVLSPSSAVGVESIH
jgi:hypothetical protein